MVWARPSPSLRPLCLVEDGGSVLDRPNVVLAGRIWFNFHNVVYLQVGSDCRVWGSLRRAYLRKLNAKKSLKRAQRFGYLYGGALAIMGINDGGRYWEPVKENKIKSIEHIHVFDHARQSSQG